jgi:apolipoprotein N-acyltransferase
VVPSSAFRKFAALWPWACAIISGVFLAFCYPGWDQGWLIWLALAPLIAAVWFSKRPARRAWLRDALLGYVAGFVFFTITFVWLGEPLAQLFQNPWLVCLPPLLAAYLAVYPAFWAWFIGALPRGDMLFLSSWRNIRIAFLAACAWIAQEWVRGWFLGGFGWNGLGIALHRNIAIIQIADIAGVWGLSFLVAFANVIALITIRRFSAEIGRTRIRPHWDFSLLMAAVVGAFSYGVHVLQHPVDLPARQGGKTVPLQVAAIQPDIPESYKSDEAHVQEIFNRYNGLTRTALALQPQLLLWPEAATLDDLYEPNTFGWLREIAGTTDAAFMFGSFLSPPGEGDYNIAACLTRRGRDVQIYRKMHLVPFGEYIPLRHAFPLFAWIVGELVPHDLLAGKEYTVFKLDTPPIRVGPLICFEDTDGDHDRHFVEAGAQVLVNITNDSWFGRSPGAVQHLANAMFCTIENRRPLVRDANTGITCIIDAEGRLQHDLRGENGSPFIEGVLYGTVNVPTAGPLTFYTRHGDWLVYLCVAVTIAAIPFRWIRK